MSILALSACNGGDDPHDLMAAEATRINGMIYALNDRVAPQSLSDGIDEVNTAINTWNTTDGNIELAGLNLNGTTRVYLSFHVSRHAAMTTSMEAYRDEINAAIAALVNIMTSGALQSAIDTIDSRIANWNNNPQTVSLIGHNTVELDNHRDRVEPLQSMETKRDAINDSITALGGLTTISQIGEFQDRINDILNDINGWNIRTDTINLIGVNTDTLALHRMRAEMIIINAMITDLADHTYTRVDNEDTSFADFLVAYNNIRTRINVWNANPDTLNLEGVNTTGLTGHRNRMRTERMQMEREEINVLIEGLHVYTTAAQFGAFQVAVGAINARRTAWDANPDPDVITLTGLNLTGATPLYLSYHQNRMALIRFDVEQAEINADIAALAAITDIDALEKAFGAVWERINAWDNANPTLLMIFDNTELTAQMNRLLDLTEDRTRLLNRANDLRSLLATIGFGVSESATFVSAHNLAYFHAWGTIFGASIHLGAEAVPTAQNRVEIRFFADETAFDTWRTANGSADGDRFFNDSFGHVFINASNHGLWFFENLIDNELDAPTAIGAAPNVAFENTLDLMQDIALELMVRHSVFGMASNGQPSRLIALQIHSATGQHLYSGLLQTFSSGIGNAGNTTFFVVVFGCDYWADAAYNGPLFTTANHRRVHGRVFMASMHSPFLVDIVYDFLDDEERTATGWTQEQIEMLDAVLPALIAAGFAEGNFTWDFMGGYFDVFFGSLEGQGQAVAVIFTTEASAIEFYESNRVFNGNQMNPDFERERFGNIVIYGPVAAVNAMLAVLVDIGLAGFRIDLDVPENVSIDSNLILSWDAVPDAFGFEIRITGTTDSGAAVEFAFSLPNTATQVDLTDLGLREGDFYAEVRALGGIRDRTNVYLSSAFSVPIEFEIDNFAAVTLETPQNVRIQASVLRWDSVPLAEAGFTVTINGTEHAVAAGVTSLNLAGLELTPGIHTISVRANEVADQLGVTHIESGDSAEITFRNIMLAPPNPRLDLFQGIVWLDWDLVAGAASYRVYLEVAGEWVFVGTSTSFYLNLSSVHHLLTAGTHEFRVSAVAGNNVVGGSGNSFWHVPAGSVSPFSLYTLTVVGTLAPIGNIGLNYAAGAGSVTWTRPANTTARVYINRPNMAAGEFVFLGNLGAGAVGVSLAFSIFGIGMEGEYVIRVATFGALGTYASGIWNRPVSVTDFEFEVEDASQPLAGTFSSSFTGSVLNWTFSGNSSAYRIYVLRTGETVPVFFTTVFASNFNLTTGFGANQSLAAGDEVFIYALSFASGGANLVLASVSVRGEVTVGAFTTIANGTFAFNAVQIVGTLFGLTNSWYNHGSGVNALMLWQDRIAQLDGQIAVVTNMINSVISIFFNGNNTPDNRRSAIELLANLLFDDYEDSEFIINGNVIEWRIDGQLYRTSIFSLVPTQDAGVYNIMPVNSAFLSSMLFNFTSLNLGGGPQSVRLVYDSNTNQILLYGIYFPGNYRVVFE